MAFGLNFFTLAPGLRVAGDSLAYAYKFTKKGGQGDGKEGLEIGLTDDPTIRLLEAAVSGYEQVTDRDTVYTALVSCLLYTSPSPRDRQKSRMPSSA